MRGALPVSIISKCIPHHGGGFRSLKRLVRVKAGMALKEKRKQALHWLERDQEKWIPVFLKNRATRKESRAATEL